jgi:hypothetical protein
LRTNPIEPPSGDRNGPRAPSVPGIMRDSSASNRRTKSRYSPSTWPSKTAKRPSAATATDETSATCGGGSIAKRTLVGSGSTRGLLDSPLPRSAPPATVASATLPSRSHGARTPQRLRAVRPAWRSYSTSERMRRASAASCSRYFGSRCRQRLISRRSSSGVSRGSCTQWTSCRSTAASVSVVVSPRNGRSPTSISKITTPSAQMSARASTASPRACSGAMYAAVPRTTPESVFGPEGKSALHSPGSRCSPILSRALARPKSSTLTAPSAVILTLAGFRSRWTIPRSCAASSASAIWRAIGSASPSGSRPSLMRSPSVGPSMSSITRARTGAWPVLDAGESSNP